ncbi:MAG: hypothetical protein IT426_02295 [Pirellulales bacterium]|nr:hypothetical protein [Pirellulales bacterium]
MVVSNPAGSCRKRRTLWRMLGGFVLAAVIPIAIAGCSSPVLHKSPQQQLPTNPWIKPAKPEPRSAWFKSLFLREKKQPKTPSEWLDQERPE